MPERQIALYEGADWTLRIWEEWPFVWGTEPDTPKWTKHRAEGSYYHGTRHRNRPMPDEFKSSLDLSEITEGQFSGSGVIVFWKDRYFEFVISGPITDNRPCPIHPALSNSTGVANGRTH